jgi:hypothetical protein
MERCVSKEVPFASFSKVSYCKEELTATTPVDCAASAAKNLLECQEGVLLLAEKPRNRRIPESEEAGGDDDDDDEGSGEDVATARTVAAIPEPRVREMSPEGRRRMCRAPLLAAAISSSTRRKEKLRVKSGQKRRFFSCMIRTHKRLEERTHLSHERRRDCSRSLKEEVHTKDLLTISTPIAAAISFDGSLSSLLKHALRACSRTGTAI